MPCAAFGLSMHCSPISRLASPISRLATSLIIRFTHLGTLNIKIETEEKTSHMV